MAHNHASRHAVVFAPHQESKELLHPLDQLSKLVYATDNDLREVLEITRSCFNVKGFSTITSNPDVIQGVGPAPQAASSLSDFVMYGGYKNPYVEDLKEHCDKKAAQENQNEQEKTKLTKQENETPMSVLHRGSVKDSSRVTLRPNKPPPRLLPTAKVQFKDAFDIGGEQEGAEDDLGIVMPTSKVGLSVYSDSMNEEMESPARAEDQRVHGDALDFISEKKPGFLKHSQTMPSAGKSPQSQGVAMPKLSLQRVPDAPPKAEQIPEPSKNPDPVPAPPPIDIPQPPSIDVPQPPPIDIPQPPSIDIPQPPPIDVPQPPSIDIPQPPPIDVPQPPSAPTPPKTEASGPKVAAPAATSERGNFVSSF